MSHSYFRDTARKGIPCSIRVPIRRETTGGTGVLAHNGLSVETPHDAHSFVVPAGSTATKCVPFHSHLYSSRERNVRHAADAVFRLFDGDSSISFTFRSSTATRSYSRRSMPRACEGSPDAFVTGRRGTPRPDGVASRSWFEMKALSSLPSKGFRGYEFLALLKSSESYMFAV